MHRLALAAVALSSLATPRSANAFCSPPQMMAPLVITNRPIASDGGILVLTEGKIVDNGPVPQRVKSDGVAAAPDVVPLAPGLVLYRLPPGTKQAQVLEGKTVVATIKVDATTPPPPRLAAPRIKRIASQIQFSRKTEKESVAVLAAAPPTGAVALVVTNADDGRALTFGLPANGAMEVRVFHHFGCGTLPEGMEIPMMRSKVKLHWIDASGRASAETAAFTVNELSRP